MKEKYLQYKTLMDMNVANFDTFWSVIAHEKIIAEPNWCYIKEVILIIKFDAGEYKKNW